MHILIDYAILVYFVAALQCFHWHTFGETVLVSNTKGNNLISCVDIDLGVKEMVFNLQPFLHFSCDYFSEF